MILKDFSQLVGWRIEIIATDLSNDVLEKAKAGIYSQFEVQRGLPIQMLVKHFIQSGETWQISPEIRAMVQYRQLNLLTDFAHLGRFDLVFCRNVLIYFDQPTKVDVLMRIARVTEPDGILVLGAAETVVGLTDAFKPLTDRRGLYAPNPAATFSRPVCFPCPLRTEHVRFSIGTAPGRFGTGHGTGRNSKSTNVYRPWYTGTVQYHPEGEPAGGRANPGAIRATPSSGHPRADSSG